MDELLAVGGGAPDEMDDQDPGSTFAFGVDGWEATEYVDPADDWGMLPDGSWLSPDGLTRTWPLAGPEPA